MNKFEEIIGYNKNCNEKGFGLLVSCIKDDYFHYKENRRNIITYTGTGLSFYCKSWGRPFLHIKDYFKEDYTGTEDLDELFNSGEYMKLGDELESAIKNNDKGNSFNNEFSETIAEFGAKDCEFSEKRSIFLLPYISFSHITTNCDDSLKIAYERTKGISPAPLYNNCENLDNEEYFAYNRDRIIYIHGGWRYPETLVLTQTLYDEFYKKDGKINPNSPIVRFLRKSAKEKHMIFIGSSLSDKDLAIEVIKDTLREAKLPDHILQKRASHIAFFREKNKNNQKDKNTECHKYRIQPVFTEEFEDQSTFLREAIREVRNPNWNNQEIYPYKCEDCHEICDNCSKVLREIIDIMECESTFEIATILPENEIFLSETLKNYLYDSAGARTYQWRICRINNDFGFNFDYQSPPPNPEVYDLPLGNTIYVIGGNKMTNRTVKDFADHIAELCDNQEFKEKFHNIKIRVIEIKSKESTREIKEIKEKEIENKLNSVNFTLNIIGSDYENNLSLIDNLVLVMRMLKSEINQLDLGNRFKLNVDEIDNRLEPIVHTTQTFIDSSEVKIKKMES